MSQTKKLEGLIARARELSETKDRTDEQNVELESVMAEAKSARDAIVRSRTIDEFTRTISEDVDPKGKAAKAESDEVYLGHTNLGPFGVYAEKKGWDDAVAKWSEKKLDTHWGFDLKYRPGLKADVDNAVAEVGSGSVAAGFTGPQYGGAVAPFYYPGIIEPPTRQPMVADLFAAGSTDSNMVRLVKETFTSSDADATAVGGHGAAATAEGAAYGAVKLEVSPVDFAIRDITALLPVTEDILTDIPAMSAYLSMRLSKFVQLAEEGELVNGDGSGSHLTGLSHISGVTTHAQGSDDLDTAVQKLNARVYQQSFLDPEWVLMSPATWAAYTTLRTDLNGGHGQFLAGPPSLAAVRNIWGLPITVSPVIADNKVYVGNRAAGMIFRNGGLRVESSTGYGTFFGEGLVAIRGKIRTTLAMFRPQAIGVLTLTASSTLAS